MLEPGHLAGAASQCGSWWGEGQVLRKALRYMAAHKSQTPGDYRKASSLQGIAVGEGQGYRAQEPKSFL